jgi:hypothetical protein
MAGLGVSELLILFLLLLLLIVSFVVRWNRTPTEKPPDDDAGW